MSSECTAENIGAGIMKRHDDPSVRDYMYTPYVTV
jgi:hypothetical protein